MKENNVINFLEKTKLKTKLFILAGISIFGFVLLSGLLFFSIESIKLISDGVATVQELHKNLLTFRRHEKDFLERRDDSYLDKFRQNIIYMKEDVRQLDEILISFNIDDLDLKDFEKAVKDYQESFFKFAKNKELFDLKHNEGLHKEMRLSAHKAEEILERIDITIEKELNNKIVRLTYTIYFLSILISLLILLLSRLLVKNIVYNFEEKVNEKTKALEKSLITLKNIQAELIQNEKMASLGSLVAGVSHEINTPIGIALTASTHNNNELYSLEKSYLNQKMSEKEFLDYLDDTKQANESIYKNLRNAVSLIKSFKQVSVDQTSNELREFNLKEYIDEILSSIHNKVKKTKTTFNINIDKNIIIYSNPGYFSQIFTNLIMNSIIHGFDNGKKDGCITISVQFKKNYLKIFYEDNGKGLDEITKKKIFDPFYTTNRGKGGSGLGMNIVYNLVTKKLNGNIVSEDKKINGVRFIIECKLNL